MSCGLDALVKSPRRRPSCLASRGRGRAFGGDCPPTPSLPLAAGQRRGRCYSPRPVGAPGTNADQATVAQKLERLLAPHVAQLNGGFRDRLLARLPNGGVPWFDPDEAGDLSARVA